MRPTRDSTRDTHPPISLSFSFFKNELRIQKAKSLNLNINKIYYIKMIPILLHYWFGSHYSTLFLFISLWDTNLWEYTFFCDWDNPHRFLYFAFFKINYLCFSIKKNIFFFCSYLLSKLIVDKVSSFYKYLKTMIEAEFYMNIGTLFI